MGVPLKVLVVFFSYSVCVCARYQVVSVCPLLGVDKWRQGRELRNKVLGGREVGEMFVFH